jgi:hypothetical protein
MTFRLELWKSLQDPESKFYQLKIAEVIPINLRKVALLVFASIVTAIIRAVFALDTVDFSHLMTEYSASEFEFIKALIGFGGIIEAFVSPIIYLIFVSFCFSIFLDNVSFRQAFAVSTISLLVFIIGDLALLPFEIWFGVNSNTSPFALGVITTVWTADEYLSHLFGGISIFLIWSIIIQVYAYSVLSKNRKFFIILLTVTIHLLLILFSVLQTFLEIYLALQS